VTATSVSSVIHEFSARVVTRTLNRRHVLLSLSCPSVCSNFLVAYAASFPILLVAVCYWAFCARRVLVDGGRHRRAPRTRGPIAEALTIIFDGQFLSPPSRCTLKQFPRQCHRVAARFSAIGGLSLAADHEADDSLPHTHRVRRSSIRCSRFWKKPQFAEHVAVALVFLRPSLPPFSLHQTISSIHLSRGACLVCGFCWPLGSQFRRHLIWAPWSPKNLRGGQLPTSSALLLSEPGLGLLGLRNFPCLQPPLWSFSGAS